MAEAKKEKVSNIVTMSDGSKVDFGTRKMLKEVVVTDGVPGVKFLYANGNIALYEVPETHRLYSAGHGYAQKLGDAVAGLKYPANHPRAGQPAEVDDMQLEIEALHDRLSHEGSDWNERGEGGSSAGGALIVQAFAEASNKTLDQAKAWINAKIEVEQAKAKSDSAYKPLTRAGIYESLRRTDRIKPILARLEAERDAKRAAPAVSGDELLAEAMA